MKSEKNRTGLQRLSAFLPAVILMMAIFFFSAQPAEESSVVSESFGTELLGTLNRLLGFGWNLERILSTSEEAQHLIRKTAHFTEYAALGAAFFFAFLVNLPAAETDERRGSQGALMRILRRPAVIWGLSALTASSLFAVSDEIHQLFVPGRAGMVQDVLVDCLGALVGVLLFILLRHRRLSRR